MSYQVLKRWLLVLLFISPLIIIVSLAIYHSPNSYDAAHKRALEKIREVVVRWAQKKYLPLIDRSSIKGELEHLKIDGSPLTPEMREAYSTALVNFLFAFKDGNIESWKQFRFDGLTGDLTDYGIFQVKFYYGLAKKDNDNSAYPDYAPRDTGFLLHWSEIVNKNAPTVVGSSEKELEELFYKFLGGITYQKLYKNYFDGICMDEIIVKHDHYISHPTPLDQYPFFQLTVQGVGAIDATFPNLGYQIWSNEGPTASFFRVHPTLTELLSEKGEVDCINTFVYIKINETGEVAPFLLRHVWNPTTKRWDIAEIVDAHISSYNRVIRVIAL